MTPALRKSQRIAQEWQAERDAENVERRKAHAERLRKHSEALRGLSAERDRARDEQAAVLAEVEGRGASLAELRCARDSDGMRRLYEAISGNSAIPERLRDGAAGSGVDMPAPVSTGLPSVPDGVPSGATSE